MRARACVFEPACDRWCAGMCRWQRVVGWLAGCVGHCDDARVWHSERTHYTAHARISKQNLEYISLSGRSLHKHPVLISYTCRRRPSGFCVRVRVCVLRCVRPYAGWGTSATDMWAECGAHKVRVRVRVYMVCNLCMGWMRTTGLLLLRSPSMLLGPVKSVLPGLWTGMVKITGKPIFLFCALNWLIRRTYTTVDNAC